MRLIAAVDDLFFLARIRETARQVGVPIETVPTARLEATLKEGLIGDSLKAVVLDLSSNGAVELIRALKTNPQTRPSWIVGFASHVATGLVAAARAAGCDQVLARSAFTRQLPDLLRSLAVTDQ